MDLNERLLKELGREEFEKLMASNLKFQLQEFLAAKNSIEAVTHLNKVVDKMAEEPHQYSKHSQKNLQSLQQNLERNLRALPGSTPQLRLDAAKPKNKEEEEKKKLDSYVCTNCRQPGHFSAICTRPKRQ